MKTLKRVLRALVVVVILVPAQLLAVLGVWLLNVLEE